MDKIKTIEETIIRNGFRLTKSRRAVIKFFAENEGHYKPEDVYQTLDRGTIGLATVYRNLDVLKKIGIIREIVINNKVHYELDMYSKKKLHLHFNCKKCNKIIEYTDQVIIQSLLEQKDFIENNYDNQVDDITIIMKGICKECKNS